MSVGMGLLVTLIRDERPISVLDDEAITRDEFTAAEQKMFTFMVDHFQKYGQMPELRTMEEHLEEDLSSKRFPREPIGYWIELVKSRTIHTTTSGLIEELERRLKLGDITVDSVRDAISQALTRMDRVHPSMALSLLSDEMQQALEDHDRRRSEPGIRGLPFGFPYLDQISDGAQPGDTVAIAGRPQAGKSALLLKSALIANRMGRSPLFFGMEMPIRQQARRALAMEARMPDTLLKLGRITTQGRMRLDRFLQEYRDSRPAPFYLAGAGLGANVDDLYTRVRELRPSGVWVDGAYLMRTSDRSLGRYDRVAEVADRLKDIAQTLNVAVIATYQFNRRGPGSLDNLGYCLSGDTLIYTTKGYERLREAPSVLEVWNGRSFAQAEKLTTGVKKVYRLELENGTAVKASADHKFLAWDVWMGFGWKPLSGLNKRDYCLVFGSEDSQSEIAQVVRITPVGEEETYDISITDSGQPNAFVANGILVHNSDAIGQLASIVIGIRDELRKEQGLTLSSRKTKLIDILKGRDGESGCFSILFDMWEMLIAQDEVLTGMDSVSSGDG